AILFDMSPGEAPAPAHDSVSPPGDLPLHVVEARVAAQETQFRHDNTISPAAPRPDEPVEVWATSGLGVHLERAAVLYTTDGTWPDASAALLPMEAAAVDWDARA